MDDSDEQEQEHQRHQQEEQAHQQREEQVRQQQEEQRCQQQEEQRRQQEQRMDVDVPLVADDDVDFGGANNGGLAAAAADNEGLSDEDHAAGGLLEEMDRMEEDSDSMEEDEPLDADRDRAILVIQLAIRRHQALKRYWRLLFKPDLAWVRALPRNVPFKKFLHQLQNDAAWAAMVAEMCHYDLQRARDVIKWTLAYHYRRCTCGQLAQKQFRDAFPRLLLFLLKLFLLNGDKSWSEKFDSKVKNDFENLKRDNGLANMIIPLDEVVTLSHIFGKPAKPFL